MSTSAQLTFVTSSRPEIKSQQTNKSIDYFPYLNNQFLMIAASLNGGNVLQYLITTIKKVNQQFADVTVSESKIWDKIIELGMQFLNHENDQNKKDKTLKIKPILFGERHQPDVLGSIDNISLNVDFGELIVSFCEGLIDNIFEMMSVELMVKSGIETLIGTGSALIKNAILQKILDQKLNDKIQVIFTDGNDAHIGVAMLVNEHFNKI